MLPIVLGSLACVYVLGAASAFGILGAFEAKAGGRADLVGVARVAFLWPVLAVATFAAWALFHKRSRQ